MHCTMCSCPVNQFTIMILMAATFHPILSVIKILSDANFLHFLEEIVVRVIVEHLKSHE